MWTPGRIALVLGIALCAVVNVAAPRAAGPGPARPEIRALWVDAFHAGMRSRAEVDQLVADATRVHVNTVFAQVRRRADALYASTIEPPLDDPAYDPRFDALAYLIERAHAAGLKVHAWMNAMPVWRDEAAPKAATHIYNLHGPNAKGADNWLTRNREGAVKFPVGYFLDPGHPAARDHLVSVYLDVVRRYAVDGIHFDYIRYPETDERLPRGSNVGYNPVSLERFARATGITAVPMPGDEAWIRWRQQQVTELVRRVALEARAINPRIVVSAACIAWGRPPRDEADFANTSPMQRVFQNWPAWLEEGVLDLAVPMNYAREQDATVREWFNGWIAWEKRHKHDRHLAVGVGGYLSIPEHVLAQIGRARVADGKRAADGVSLFSYAAPSLAPSGPAANGTPASAQAGVQPARLDFLGGGLTPAPAAFAAAAPVPAMRWLEHPERGHLAGRVLAQPGAPVTAWSPAVDGVRVRISRRGLFGRTVHVATDASGWFGVAGLKPGKYRVTIDGGGPSAAVEVQVAPGRVARVELRR